ncbi:MAG: PDZ domain-containing protein, partial [Eubacteriales bacterium]|nr:PDZ domain-containing protein [Eubacteriales bacterium]
MMRHYPQTGTRLLVLLLSVMLMLTGCALLPTSITDAVTQEPVQTAQDGDTITISRAEYERLQKYQELDELKQLVEEYYYQEPDEQAMLDGAEMGLLYGLQDPYTFFYDPESFSQMWEDDQGDYAGIGIQIMADYVSGACTITRVFLDSPALEAGLRKGDVLVKVDDLDVVATTLNDAVTIMRGVIGETVNVQILRGDQVLDFVIARAKVHTNWVNSCMMENDVGYISLYEFSGDCSVAFQEQMDQLLSQGAKVLLVDLRDNPGGWVDDA